MLESAPHRIPVQAWSRQGTLREAGGWNRGEVIAAAPYAIAALWAAATGASVLFWAVTGSLGPLDWCRSGSVLVGAAVLVLLTGMVGVLKAAGRRRAEPSRPAPVPHAGGWRF